MGEKEKKKKGGMLRRGRGRDLFVKKTGRKGSRGPPGKKLQNLGGGGTKEGREYRPYCKRRLEEPAREGSKK